MNSSNDKRVGALFALNALIRKDNLSRLTTIIRQGKFGDSYADIATIESSDGTEIATCYVVWPTMSNKVRDGSSQ